MEIHHPAPKAAALTAIGLGQVGGGGAGRADRRLGSSTMGAVSYEEIKEVITACQHNVFLRSVVSKVLNETVECGLAIKLMYETETVDLPDSQTMIVEREWMRIIREVLWCVLVVGFAVVARDERTRLPFVVPFDKVQVSFAASAFTRRQYHVERRTSAFGGSDKLKCRLIIKYHPDDAGHLTSPGAASFQHVLAIQRVLQNQQSADYVRAHPVWPYEIQPNPVAGTPLPTDTDMYVEGDLHRGFAAYLQKMRAHQAVNFAETEQLGRRAHSTAVACSAHYMGYNMVPPDVAANPPQTNFTMVPMGTRLVQPITPQQNGLYTPELEMHTSFILMAFHIPPMVMELAHSIRYSAQPEEARIQWADTVRTLQRELAPVLEDLYTFANPRIYESFVAKLISQEHEKKAAAASVLQRVRERVEAAPGTQEAETRGKEKRSDTASADSEPIELPTLVKNDDGTLRFGETEETLKQAVQVLTAEISEQRMLEVVKHRLKVIVEFKTRPRFSIKDLETAVRAGIMPMDQYAKHFAEITGLPLTSMLLTKEAREEEAKERAEVTVAGAVQTDENGAPVVASSSSTGALEASSGGGQKTAPHRTQDKAQDKKRSAEGDGGRDAKRRAASNDKD